MASEKCTDVSGFPQSFARSAADRRPSEGVGPSELARELLSLVAEATGCHTTWEQHRSPVTRLEVLDIIAGFEALCERTHPGAFLDYCCESPRLVKRLSAILARFQTAFPGAKGA